MANMHLIHRICLTLLFTSASYCSAGDAPPNVVLIFADDLGYGDLGCYGATKVRTPNIDKLAKEGRRFTDAHSVSAVCTASRYALLTGRYPLRATGPRGGSGVWGPAPVESPLLVDTDKTTIADVFKNKGYRTAAFGKWHLGSGEGKNTWKQPLRPGPQDLGFDYYFGMPIVNSAPPYVYVENDRVFGADPADPLVHLGRNAKGVTAITPIPPEAAQRSANQFGGAKKAHELFNDYQVGTTLAKKSVDWINQRKGEPFFLYMATTNIHHPFTPAKRFQGTSQCGLYGEIMTCLEQNGLSDNTMVIFTSDNGGMFNLGGQTAFKARHRQNGDLLGFKFGVWEGGHRVPMIVRWPGKVKAGTTSNQLIGNVDMLATFAALTKQTLDKNQQADSENVLSAFVDEPQKPIRDHLVLAPRRSSHLSLRSGKWMYIPARGSGGFGGTKPGQHGFSGPAAASFVGSVNSDIANGRIKKTAPAAQLYDLENDVNETKNVYREHPEVVKELRKVLAGYKPPEFKRQRQPARGNPRNNPAKKIPATSSARSAVFDFESSKLAPWKIVEGHLSHVIGSRDEFFNNKGQYNKQGKYYLTTLEVAAEASKGNDSQTGVIVSPMFIPEPGNMTFRIGGGQGKSTYVALCTADGKETEIARGVNSQVMQEAAWDLTPYAGKKMFLKIVDKSSSGWGHITVDNFQFDANVLDEHPTISTSGRASVGVDENTGTITGQAVLPSEIPDWFRNDKLSLKNAVVVIEGMYQGPRLKRPKNYSKMSREERQAWSDEYKKTDAYKEYDRKRRAAYAGRPVRKFPVEADGSFTVKGLKLGRYNVMPLIPHPAAKGKELADQSWATGFKQIVLSQKRKSINVGKMELKLKNVVMPGDLAPSWTAEDYDGKKIHSADFRGKFLIVDFWATWCSPCIAEMPNLERIYKEFGGDKLAVVGLSIDDKIDLTREFLATRPTAYPQGYLGRLNEGETTTRAFGIRSVPSIWLISPDGRVVARDLGGEKVGDAVRKALRK